jgi:hypothetical protein
MKIRKRELGEPWHKWEANTEVSLKEERNFGFDKPETEWS